MEQLVILELSSLFQWCTKRLNNDFHKDSWIIFLIGSQQKLTVLITADGAEICIPSS